VSALFDSSFWQGNAAKPIQFQLRAMQSRTIIPVCYANPKQSGHVLVGFQQGVRGGR